MQYDASRVSGLVFAVALVLTLAVSWPLGANAQPRSGDRKYDANRDPIDSGLVVIDGEVLPPPYTVRADTQGETTVNGRPLRLWPTERFERDDHDDHDKERGWDDGRDRRRFMRWSPRRVIERGLEQDLVVMVITGEGHVSFHVDRLPDFVDTVTSKGSDADKIATLDAMSFSWNRSEPWQAIVDLGVVDPALHARAREVQTRLDEAKARREAIKAQQRTEERRDKFYRALLPVLAIAGVLIAIAALLHTLRSSWSLPVEHRAWRHIDPTGTRTRAVVQLAAVLVLLNGMDLLFTILAQQTGQFFELNPVGERLIDSPVALGYYKTTLVAVGVGILLFLRRRRAAEITAWWLCALYMLVLIRWVAVNTVMVA